MKRITQAFILLLPFILPNIIYAVSVYNSDGRPHDIEVADIRSGSRQTMTVYSTGTSYVRCRHGCEISVLETDDTITVEPETSHSSKTVVIGDGTLRVR